MRNRKEQKKHFFSVELEDKNHLKRFLILNDSGNKVLFEGFLGELKQISLIESAMLEVRGSNGILIMDMTEEELHKTLKNSKCG